MEKYTVLRNSEKHLDNAMCCTPEVYGVTGPGVILNGFDIGLHTPPDVMHDLAEGVIGKVTKQVLKRFRENTRGLLVKDIQKLTHFNYGSYDKQDKLTKISEDTLIGTATAKWNFCRLLPLMIFVTFGIALSDDLVNLIDKLNAIVAIAFAPEIHQYVINDLDNMVSEFIELYCNIFPDKTVIPKMHHLIHYSSYILKLGPLKHLSALRGEAKSQRHC
jgi:hypothetical protein